MAAKAAVPAPISSAAQRRAPRRPTRRDRADEHERPEDVGDLERRRLERDRRRAGAAGSGEQRRPQRAQARARAVGGRRPRPPPARAARRERRPGGDAARARRARGRHGGRAAARTRGLPARVDDAPDERRRGREPEREGARGQAAAAVAAADLADAQDQQRARAPRPARGRRSEARKTRATPGVVRTLRTMRGTVAAAGQARQPIRRCPNRPSDCRGHDPLPLRPGRPPADPLRGVAAVRGRVERARAAAARPRRRCTRPWVADARECLAGLDWSMLDWLANGYGQFGFVPDFITPPPATPLADVDGELERVRATPPEQVAREVGWRFEGREVPAVVRPLLDDPAAGLDRLVDVMRAYWERVIEPWWPAIRARARGRRRPPRAAADRGRDDRGLRRSPPRRALARRRGRGRPPRTSARSSCAAAGSCSCRPCSRGRESSR